MWLPFCRTIEIVSPLTAVECRLILDEKVDKNLYFGTPKINWWGYSDRGRLKSRDEGFLAIQLGGQNIRIIEFSIEPADSGCSLTGRVRFPYWHYPFLAFVIPIFSVLEAAVLFEFLHRIFFWQLFALLGAGVWSITYLPRMSRKNDKAFLGGLAAVVQGTVVQPSYFSN